MAKPVFLFAFAGSRGNLDTGNEHNVIQTALKKLRDESRVVFLPSHESTFKDISSNLNDYHDRIAIFHYGGHSNDENLFLEDGPAEAVTFGEGLGQEKNLKLVILNGCSNSSQVNRLFEFGVKAVIATSSDVSDELAIEFARLFYEALAANRSIREAYKFCVTQFTRNNPTVEILKDAETWRTDRGLARRKTAGQEFSWGLFTAPAEDAKEILDWKVPGAGKKLWLYSALALLFPLGFAIARLISPPPAAPPPVDLCPEFSDSATFRIAILPMAASPTASELALWDELNDLNRDHRKNHPGRQLFNAEAEISKRKFTESENTIDSLLGACAEMVIYGLPDSPENAPVHAVRFNARSTEEVRIDEETSLAFDPVTSPTISGAVEPWARTIFALVDDVYFKCLDPESGDALVADLSGKSADTTDLAQRLGIATQVLVSNNRIGEALAMYNRFPEAVDNTPGLIRNFGLTYVLANDFKNASHTLMRMPADQLDQPFLLFRLKVHRKAGYFSRALEDIDRLMHMNPAPGLKTQLDAEKSELSGKLEQSRLKNYLADMELAFKANDWEKSLQLAGKALDIRRNNDRALFVSMESGFQMKEWARSREFAQRILSLNSKDLAAGERLVAIYIQEQNWQSAVLQARKTLQLYKGSFAAHSGLIRALVAQKKTSEACQAYNEAVSVLGKKGNKAYARQFKELTTVCNGCCGAGVD